MEEINKTVDKRIRDEPEPNPDPEVKRLRKNLLECLDDDDSGDVCTSSTQDDLDSYMKSFQEEITPSPSAATEVDLGYLLEASDDELGIPPPADMKGESVRVVDKPNNCDFGAEFLDPFGFGFGEAGNWDAEYVALDGLFDYSDLGIVLGDFSIGPETLPAQ